MDNTMKRKDDPVDIIKDITKPETGGVQCSNAPFISVMVLNYSYGELLARALDACAAQTYRDFEVVMINNGAIDNTEEIYKDFCEKYPEVTTTYVHVEPNQGPMHGWNEGLKQARGEYVLFNDADDWMDPDCLEKLAQKAKETGADRICGNFRDVQPNGEVIREHYFDEQITVPTPMIQSTLFRRNYFLENGCFFPEDAKSVAYDYWLTYRFAAAGKEHNAIVKDVTYNYLINPKSMMANMWTGGEAEHLLETNTKLLITFTAEAVERVDDKAISDEIEYILIKGSYAHIINIMRHCSAADAKNYHDRTVEFLDEKIPGWKKNPHLWPVHNGYGPFDSVCLYALVWMTRLHAMWMLRLAGKMSKLLKFRR